MIYFSLILLFCCRFLQYYLIPEMCAPDYHSDLAVLPRLPFNSRPYFLMVGRLLFGVAMMIPSIRCRLMRSH